jgi:hypothetical protein
VGSVSHWQQLGLEFHTDKATHTYMPVYERFLGPKASDPINLLEIGIERGASINLWLKLFPNGHIFCLDYRQLDLDVLRHPRVTAFLGRYQQDPDIINLFERESMDVIVDDGGHFLNLQRDSREILWPALKTGGLYFVEDILTDVYPDEIAHYQEDPDCIFAEANRHDIYGKYERADAIVVLQKHGERPGVPLMTPIEDRFTDYYGTGRTS